MPYPSGINQNSETGTEDVYGEKYFGNYFEDNYIKHECQDCRRCFIVGEVLSESRNLSCPYCGSRRIEITAASAAETDEDMGCLGLYFSRYDDGGLMLYTEREFAEAMRRSIENGGADGISLSSVHSIITNYCTRDGRGAD